MHRAIRRLAACLATLLVLGTAAGQSAPPRFGLGFNMLISTADGVGLGFRGRVATPVNADLSIGVDLGFTGFVLEGRRDATYVFDPQVSAIVNLPFASDRAPYVLGGVGAYVPLSNEDDSASGPTLHFGIGWVHLLRETTLYYEIDPALVIAEDRIHLALPLRFGIIF